MYSVRRRQEYQCYILKICQLNQTQRSHRYSSLLSAFTSVRFFTYHWYNRQDTFAERYVQNCNKTSVSADCCLASEAMLPVCSRGMQIKQAERMLGGTSDSLLPTGVHWAIRRYESGESYILAPAAAALCSSGAQRFLHNRQHCVAGQGFLPEDR